MRIVHLSTNDTRGGAARSAFRLHNGLLSIGQESSLLVAFRSSGDGSVVAAGRQTGLTGRIKRGVHHYFTTRELDAYCSTRPAGYEIFSDDRTEYTSLARQLPNSDVLNLHWVASFVDYRSFFDPQLPTPPMVWTLHDMNSMTGGCHYNHECSHYLQTCGQCPQLGSSDPHDLSYRVWQRKRSVLSRVSPSRLRFVTPSRWLAEEVKQSPMLGRFDVSVIPYGLNLDVYAPRNRAAIRALLGVPQGAKVVLFVADLADIRRKGFSLLLESLFECEKKVPGLFLLSLGHNMKDTGITVPSLHLGSLDNDMFLSMVYSAADIFVIPSLQDNLPNTALEALACGVPIVGFAAGGINDIVREGVTGRKVPVKDSAALGSAIVELLNSPSRCAEMGANSRRIALEEYALDIQARRYVEIYRDLLDRSVAVKGRAG